MKSKKPVLRLLKEETGASRLELWGFRKPEESSRSEERHETSPEYAEYFAGLRSLRQHFVIHLPGLGGADDAEDL